MKDAIGFGAIVLTGVMLYLISIPGYKTAKDYSSLCPDSHSITVDGKFVGCIGDKMQSANYMWMPKGRPVPMQDIKELDDSWMDGP